MEQVILVNFLYLAVQIHMQIITTLMQISMMVVVLDILIMENMPLALEQVKIMLI